MANIKLKKADLKGPLLVGEGWLLATAWAVRVGDDKRLQNVETLQAAFSGLDVAEASLAQVRILEDRLPSGLSSKAYLRTQVLLEGEDGVLTRVYKLGDKHACINESFLKILGDPPWLTKEFNLFGCPAGFVACTTDQAPDWVWSVV